MSISASSRFAARGGRQASSSGAKSSLHRHIELRPAADSIVTTQVWCSSAAMRPSSFTRSPLRESEIARLAALRAGEAEGRARDAFELALLGVDHDTRCRAGGSSRRAAGG